MSEIPYQSTSTFPYDGCKHVVETAANCLTAATPVPIFLKFQSLFPSIERSFPNASHSQSFFSIWYCWLYEHFVSTWLQHSQISPTQTAGSQSQSEPLLIGNSCLNIIHLAIVHKWENMRDAGKYLICGQCKRSKQTCLSYAHSFHSSQCFLQAVSTKMVASN